MQVKETKINKLQYFQVRKMSKFTQDTNGLKKFSTEATDLRFPQKFIINYRTKILGTVSLLYFDAIHKKLNLHFQELVEVNIIYAVLFRVFWLTVTPHRSTAAISPFALHWMCDSPRTGYARITIRIYYVVQTCNTRVIPPHDL